MELLKSINTFCRNECTVHINVPNAKSFHRMLAYESGLVKNVIEKSEKNVKMQQHSVFDMESLLEIIEMSASEAGRKCEILEKGSYFVKPFTHRQMEMCLSDGIITPQVIDGFNKMIKYMPDLGSEIFVNYKICG